MIYKAALKMVRAQAARVGDTIVTPRDPELLEDLLMRRGGKMRHGKKLRTHNFSVIKSIEFFGADTVLIFAEAPKPIPESRYESWRGQVTRNTYLMRLHGWLTMSED